MTQAHAEHWRRGCDSGPPPPSLSRFCMLWTVTPRQPSTPSLVYDVTRQREAGVPEQVLPGHEFTAMVFHCPLRRRGGTR